MSHRKLNIILGLVLSAWSCGLMFVFISLLPEGSYLHEPNKLICVLELIYVSLGLVLGLIGLAAGLRDG